MDGWCTCEYPPFPYMRIEIKDKLGRIYLGYYALNNTWLTTDGHYPIQYPYKWRWVPKDSVLDMEFRRKVRERIIETVCRIRPRSRGMQ